MQTLLWLGSHTKLLFYLEVIQVGNFALDPGAKGCLTAWLQIKWVSAEVFAIGTIGENRFVIFVPGQQPYEHLRYRLAGIIMHHTDNAPGTIRLLKPADVININFVHVAIRGGGRN